ncbi:multidrug resistance efflux pump [Bradyrhizobium japonicum]|uniref:Multidrug resistance efflux pump n=1 Tax=Bradyrhizobium japonicum TaxID=375 RepID=A0ABV2RHH4_BRAJP|nr:HlyD family secretion protein [Bradyrhizobium japonicum]MBR0804372.1 HlyD family secretion protein [Bradyrhizobium japonicum]MCS3498562.1 multidrug efflux system membrane fusion protein [Bradyrhizobium japonicum]MCS3959276.1 multidrug efflux system membrane fusion protein [Bradyrhizobium japonicum]MCS4001031.1 multidrug efflux system membrane fusion protein [Bradyrhizobium japonicum]UQD99833.1 HlyD family secretion protein [Bradyrhizobium japonicum]
MNQQLRVQLERQVLGQTTGDKKTSPLVDVPSLSTKPELDRSRLLSHRQRALLFLLVLAGAVFAWWISGYLLAYTDDAYLTSDVVSITPEVTGPIEAVHVKDNEWVGRGTLLFTIDPVPFGLAVEQARAEEARAEAQLPVDQAQLEVLRAQKDAADAAARLAAANLRRDTPLGQSGTISAQALDNTRTAEEQSTAQQHAAEAALQKATETLGLDKAAVSSAHAARLLAEWRLSRTNVVAPVDGYVTHLSVQAGDMVSSREAAVAIVDGNSWRVVANYKEYYLRHLRPGGLAWIWLDSHPWHLYRARIQGLAHGISRQPGNETLVPYVSPTVNWIRLQRRIPVRFALLDSPGADQLFMGADARVLVIY